MRVLGVSTEMTKPKRPSSHLVLLETTSLVVDPSNLSSLQVATHVITSTAGSYADVLSHLSIEVRAWARDKAIEIATIRRADRPQRAVNTDGPRYRLLADGAVTAAVRELIDDTRLLTGAETAQAWGAKMTKARMDAYGASLVSEAAYSEAAAAALSCLQIS